MRAVLRTFRVAVLIIAIVTAGRAANAATIHVPANFSTIQAAIDAAAAGDTVLVAPGTYVERIDFRGKNITVISESGPAVTFIDGGGSGSVVTFKSGESRTAVLSGFTVTGGVTIYSGAGIAVSGSSPTIRGNVVAGNRGCTGVGIYSYFSSPRIENNTIRDNIVSGCSGAWGLGVYIGGDSNAELIGNWITRNSGGDATGAGVALFAAGHASLVSNVIEENSTAANGACSGWGGGIAIANFAEARLINNVIARNAACSGGAIYWIGTNSGAGSTLVNNTIVDNSGPTYPGLYLNGVGAANRFFNNVISSATGPVLYCVATSWATAPSLDSNDVFTDDHNPYGGSCTAQTGTLGNISANANFTNRQAGDYSIGISSPLVDAGNNAAPYLPAADVAGNPRISSANGGPDRIDIGAFEFFSQGPVADAGEDQVVDASSACSATVTLRGSGFDPEGDSLTFVWSGPFGVVSGATAVVSLPAGSHVLTLTVSDGRGGGDTDTVTVTVRDRTAPAINSVAANPSVITKTNHEMVTVTIAVSATDGCGSVACRIVSVSSNEPIAGTGGGDLSPDWEITGDLTVRLRGERSPKGTGRVYTITVLCTDAAGNTSTRTTSVSVARK